MDILELPVSVTNWIILSDALKDTEDKSLYIKVFEDYLLFLPIYKVEEICMGAQIHLPTETDFQLVMETLWKNVSGLQEGGDFQAA